MNIFIGVDMTKIFMAIEIAAISDIEGGLEAMTNFNIYEDCINGGGGAVCDEIDARLNELEGEE